MASWFVGAIYLQKCDHEYFLDYWKGLKKGIGGVPLRSAVKPQDFAPQLPFYFLLERKSYFDVPFRLLGTGLDALLPTVKTGMNFLDVYHEMLRPFYADYVRDLCEHPCGAYLLRTITLSDGSEMNMNSVSLPLADDDGDVRFIAGVADAPNAGQFVGLTVDKQRIASRVVDLKYIDIGFGVPTITPTYPEHSGFPIGEEVEG